MKKLSELYENATDIEIKGIKINSKEVEPGDLFICTMGVTADRHDFIPDAIKMIREELKMDVKDNI